MGFLSVGTAREILARTRAGEYEILFKKAGAEGKEQWRGPLLFLAPRPNSVGGGGFAFCRGIGFDERDVHEVLGEEPDLELVGADDIADE